MGQNVPLNTVFQDLSGGDFSIGEGHHFTFFAPTRQREKRKVVSTPRQSSGRKYNYVDADDLDATIRQTLEKNGVNIDKEERVEFGQFKGIRWKNVEARLKRYAEYDSTFKADCILAFMKWRGIEPFPDLKRPRGNSAPPLDFDDLELAIRLTLEKGKNIKLHEKVMFGKSAGVKWSAFNQRLIFYSSTHPDCNFNSVATFMRSRGIKRLSKTEKLDLQSDFNHATVSSCPDIREDFMLVSEADALPENLIMPPASYGMSLEHSR